MRRICRSVALTAVALLIAASPLMATVLKQMNLEDLVGSADRIFSGRVIDINKGTVTSGGAELPTVTYRIVVETPFQGEFTDVKGERIVDVQMVDSAATTSQGAMVRFNALPTMPDIRMGQRYLFFTTRPSAIGLSTTVGLGQGSFHLLGGVGEEVAVNEYDNVGLFSRMSVSAPARGPIAYADLADQITALLGSK